MGFSYGGNSGPRGECGYTKKINHDGCERLWITIDIIGKSVYLYNEFSCGGMLWDRVITLTDDVLSMEEKDFVNWLDNEIG